MTGFTPEEWRTAARVARRSIFTEGNPDLADAWEKAADQVEARLIPSGGMSLTAEQVEDVKIVLGQLERGGPAFEVAHERLRALFPATEPAEEVTQAEGFCSFCGWSRDACARGEGDSAPAEPAEEETKAEGDHTAYSEAVSLSYWLAKQLGEHVDDAYDRGETLTDTVQRLIEHIRPNRGKTKTASSPVVPAPTETGPWA